MKKATRLLEILNLVKTGRCRFVYELAQELGVSERTIFRDIQDLAADLNVNLEFEEGKGYSVRGDVRLAPIQFTEEEAFVLRMALGATPIRKNPSLREPAVHALFKIEGAMNERSRRFVEQAAQKAYLDPSPHEEMPNISATYPVLERCIWEHKVAELTYRSLGHKTASRRLFNPYLLTFRAHNWYLVGWCHQRQDVIHVKLSRIESARKTDDSFQVPKDFSIEKFYEHSWEIYTGPPVEVEVLFDASMASLINETRRHASQQTEVLKDGRVRFRARVAGFVEIGWWVLTFGKNAEVVGPPEFREWIADQAVEMARIYSNNNQADKEK